MVKNLSLYFRVNNLLDEKHEHAGAAGESFTDVPQDTRSFQVGVSYNF